MAEVLPPSYADIDIHPIDTKADIILVTKVQEELLSYLKTTARGNIEADILHLRDIITAIENDFAALYREMTMLDEKNLVSDKFAPKWKILHDEYTMLMQNSQSTASSVSDKIDDLVKDHVAVLQDKKVSFDVKKGIVKEYIEELEPFLPKAEENSMRFLRLSQQVLAFKMSLRNKVEIGRHAVDEKFEKIDKEIEELELKLKKLSNVMTKGWKAFKSIFPMENKGDHDGIVAIKSLTDMAPTVGKEMMKIALNYLDSQLAADFEKLQTNVDESSTRKTLASLKFVREQRGAIDERFSTALRKLVELEPQFDGISEKMGAIQGIWKMLLTDSQTLLGKLESMSKTKYDVSFDRFASRLAVTYEALQFSLKQYALAVPKLPGAVVSIPELSASSVRQSVDGNLTRETVVEKSSSVNQNLDSGSRSDSHSDSGQVNQSTSSAKESAIPQVTYLTAIQNRVYTSLWPQAASKPETTLETAESDGLDKVETTVVQKERPTAQIVTKPETTTAITETGIHDKVEKTAVQEEHPIVQIFTKPKTATTVPEATSATAESGNHDEVETTGVQKETPTAQIISNPENTTAIAETSSLDKVETTAVQKEQPIAQILTKPMTVTTIQEETPGGHDGVETTSVQKECAIAQIVTEETATENAEPGSQDKVGTTAVRKEQSIAQILPKPKIAAPKPETTSETAENGSHKKVKTTAIQKERPTAQIVTKQETTTANAEAGSHQDKAETTAVRKEQSIPQILTNPKTETTKPETTSETAEIDGHDEVGTAANQKEPPTAQDTATNNLETIQDVAQRDCTQVTAIAIQQEYPVAQPETTAIPSPETTVEFAQSGSSTQVPATVIRKERSISQVTTNLETAARTAANGGRRKRKKKQALIQVPKDVNAQTPPENSPPGV